MLEVSIRATEPLMLGAGPQVANVIGSFDHVPGAVLRGALAARWIAEFGPPDRASAERRREFEELFERDIRYGPLLPEGASFEPLSVLRCKYEPESGCAATAFDLATEEAPAATCQACGGPLQLGKGALLGATLVARTATALDPTERAAEGMLFTRYAVPAGVTLVGHVSGAHPWLERLEGDTVWLGGRRTVGGRGVVRIRHVPDPSPTLRDDGRVVLRTTSVTVFVDDATRPLVGFPVQDLARRLGCEEVRLVAQWRRPIRIGGWHAASGLPKPQDTGIVAGSTAVFDTGGDLDPLALARIESEGIGVRRTEGFGWVSVNPPPWRPPTTGEAAVERQGSVSEIHDRLTPALADLTTRRWLVDRLKQRIVDVERGRPRPIGEYTELRFLRGVDPTTRRAILEALGIDDLPALVDLVTLLEDPRWRR
jgi:CRISPR-associated protein Csx10